MQTQIEYEYVNLLVREARKLEISDTLLHHYADYYLNTEKNSYTEAYRKALFDLKRERGVFNSLDNI